MSWKRANAWATITWLVLIPVAYALQWLQSVTFVSSISLYANVASHMAAWRADKPDPEVVERLERIEEQLAQLLRAATPAPQRVPP